jgi:hypothetical protein
MGSETYSGISIGFIGGRQFTPAEIDSIFSATPSIPAGSGTGKMNWKQFMHDGDVEFSIPRKVTKQRTSPEGIRKIVQDEDDGPELSMNLADITLYHLIKTLGLGHDPTMVAKAQKIQSNYGKDLTQLGLPMLVYHSEYDFSNKSDTPLIGSGSNSRSNTLPAQTLSDNRTVILDAGASSSDDAYNCMMISVVHSGLTMTRHVIDYVGATKTITVDKPWDIDPVSGDTFSVFAGANSADPKGLLLFNCSVMEDIKIPYKKPQQIIPVKFATVAVDGSSNPAVYGAFPLDLSQCTTISA